MEYCSVSEQLNVIDPLQIGGLATGGSIAYPALNVTTGVDGCLRNVFINEVVSEIAVAFVMVFRHGVSF